MIKLNRDKLRDKIYACWIGKNLGGTIGTPYEGKQQLNDIQGFVTKPGEVLPNDDLDLQLIWLKAMEEQGPEHVNERVLGEYWLSYIEPNWNEYGVGKSNLREGFFAPLSGELNNAKWKHSNGAWIRTEIWACLYPGCVEKAIRYAFADACVDHGFGEGSYAAIFVAAMESAAFVLSDLNVLIDIGLSKIPADCRVARSVKLVRKAYQEGVDWKQTRQMLVEDSKDLGWFQAPANVGYVILGLLYGQGDFKKSMITAVNCGDDTDCTGATVGALLGILGGHAKLPQDWVQYMGDDIVQICLLNGHGSYPKSNSQLTDCVMNMLPVTLHIPFYNAGNQPFPQVVVQDGPDELDGLQPSDYYGGDFVSSRFQVSPYSFTASSTFAHATIEFDAKPEIAPLGTLSGKITVILDGSPMQQHYHVKWFLPQGWSVSGRMNLHAHHPGHDAENTAQGAFTLTAGETVEALNQLVLQIEIPGRAECIFAPIRILG